MDSVMKDVCYCLSMICPTSETCVKWHPYIDDNHDEQIPRSKELPPPTIPFLCHGWTTSHREDKWVSHIEIVGLIVENFTVAAENRPSSPKQDLKDAYAFCVSL